MKKTYKRLFFICICAGIIFTLSSCWPLGTITDPYIVPEWRQKENMYYIPSAPNTPLHSQKNDMNLTLTATSNAKYSGGDVQASYMPGKNIGVIGSYSFANRNADFTNYHRFELGSGFVTQLSKNWHFETYAGFGNGKIHNSHSTGYSNINLTHFFLQPAVAISSESKKIQLGFVSKFTGVSFNVKDTAFNNDRESFTTSQIKSLYDQPFHIMWEPSFVFRAGWKSFQFHTGYSFSTDLTNPDLNRAKGRFAMGICFRINTMDKK